MMLILFFKFGFVILKKKIKLFLFLFFMFGLFYYLVLGKKDCFKIVFGNLGNGNFRILKKKRKS